jgi:hypothetical protein
VADVAGTTLNSFELTAELGFSGVVLVADGGGSFDVTRAPRPDLGLVAWVGS